MSEHAKYAPSAAHRWIPCPGSIRLSEGIEDKPSEYAMEGTILHTVTEQCLREKMDAEEYIGTIHDIDEYELEIDHDHADAVQYCVDEVKRIMQEYQIAGGKLEIRVNLNEQCWGTVDVLLWNTEWVIVIDFKFGRGKSVEAEGNAQLMIYFLGALKYIHENNLINPIPKKAMLVILQPRIPNPTRVWETTVDEIKTWYVKSVKPAFDAAGQVDAVCNPGEEQCQFCPANGVCTARSNYLLGVAEQEFHPYVVKEGDVPMVPAVQPLATEIKDKMDTSLDLMTPAVASKILAYQADFDNFFKKVGEFAMNAALRGEDIPGMKLVYGKSNRKWSKPDAEIATALKDLEIEPHEKKLLSPAKAEKALGKKRKGEIAELIFKPTGKKILVDENDTRETVDMQVENDMSEFAETVPPEQSDTSFTDMAASLDSPPTSEGAVKDEILQGKNAVPPSKSTKKYQLMLLGLKGGVPVAEAADALFKGNRSQVIKGLRNLNERDGYTVIFHGDDHFTVKE